MPEKKQADPPRWTEYVPLDDLIPDERNPKNHDGEVLDESIDRFGFTEQVMVDDRTGKLVAGHGRRERLLAARERGEQPPEGVTVDVDGTWKVPVLRGWRSRDDDEAMAYLVAANQITVKGGWNVDPLVAILDQLRGQSDGLLGIGYSEGDVDELLRQSGKLADRQGAFLDDLTNPIGEVPANPMSRAIFQDMRPAELVIAMATEERDEAIALLRKYQADLGCESLGASLLAVLRGFQPIYVAQAEA